MKKGVLWIVGIVFVALAIYPALRGFAVIFEGLSSGDGLTAGVAITGAGALFAIAVFFLVIGFACMLMNNQACIVNQMKEYNNQNDSRLASLVVSTKPKVTRETTGNHQIKCSCGKIFRTNFKNGKLENQQLRCPQCQTAITDDNVVLD